MPRALIAIGLLLVVAGLVAWGLERVGIRPGHLPGDIAVERGNTRFYFPIVTSILLSLLLSGALWLLGQFRR